MCPLTQLRKMLLSQLEDNAQECPDLGAIYESRVFGESPAALFSSSCSALRILQQETKLRKGRIPLYQTLRFCNIHPYFSYHQVRGIVSSLGSEKGLYILAHTIQVCNMLSDLRRSS